MPAFLDRCDPVRLTSQPLDPEFPVGTCDRLIAVGGEDTHARDPVSRFLVERPAVQDAGLMQDKSWGPIRGPLRIDLHGTLLIRCQIGKSRPEPVPTGRYIDLEAARRVAADRARKPGALSGHECRHLCTGRRQALGPYDLADDDPLRPLRICGKGQVQLGRSEVDRAEGIAVVRSGREMTASTAHLLARCPAGAAPRLQIQQCRMGVLTGGPPGCMDTEQASGPGNEPMPRNQYPSSQALETREKPATPLWCVGQPCRL